ncbi:MAG: LysM domain-containing protein, partial [Leptolyngbyaceae bacterium]|nr:LysM domain-containing protein [Leptolyngbyaceae bacterium]
MKRLGWMSLLYLFCWWEWPTLAQSLPPVSTPNRGADCPQPVLSRLIRHKILPGETLETIAQKYG